MKCGSINDYDLIQARSLLLKSQNPLLDVHFLSHGHATLKDADESAQFYQPSNTGRPARQQYGDCRRYHW